ncbi:RNA 2',3'-cyclic phosphodiesterase [Shewanella fidelis]|uniref:RNA 2',3'-cyclic phosphodiesterase n=1 Tax=Shewanella fidelis TaxID=173509 RepID=A0AAW8NQD7_9GAMM|nr:RNA 2',3'-cyclic phosphodiesterase [Shewanella fidelis]MDR8525127.1 RNA 2',3'-cyclic phosphodiesterase [Shewanella fidelis]MDW4811198.1 RNA 2',3'-cyclic phosphodiesterase [Shewanella fidelis]MDW4815023.1 RNA 2',3'-cyclic phosphodiesterase [Shewanella fidelis]MDW4819113.1 RNA 2',3'-cyclic phosphodiesterase [Shewanella fidelis]MDW4823209.1 RNA 2',3'-cyclic phosphodiesterase [Shewanella fidelis]
MTTTSKRIFLGFSLTEQQTSSVVAIQQQLPPEVRLVPAANLHMTLAFLGAATTKQMQDLIFQVDQLNKPQFSVTLDKIAHWQKPKILCLNGAATDVNLLKLAADAQSIAAKLELHCSEYSYNPHVTLSRKAKQAIEVVNYQPITLQPTKLQLFESYPGKNGVEYPSLHQWQLD